MKRLALLFASAIAGLVTAGPAAAQADYPAKTVRIVVPFAAGGSTDVLARLAGQVLGKALGGTFVVENKPGASGNIGAQAVATAAPDGYTLLFTTTNLTLNPAVTKNLPYDAVRDFAPVTQMAFAPMVLVARPDFAPGGVKEIVAQAKASPGKLSFSSSGVGGAPHLAGEMLQIAAGVKMLHVPYNGAAPALTDVVSGQVNMTFTTYISAQGLLKGGRAKAVAVASARRLPTLPDTPTFAETGFPGVEIGTQFGLLAPAKTPATIVNRLAGALRKAGESAEFREQILSQGGDVVLSTPEDYAAYVAADVAKWKDLVHRIGTIEPQ